MLPVTDVDVVKNVIKQNILLIDGDVLCHIACKDRWAWIQKERGIPHERRTYKPPEEGIIFSDAEGAKYLRESYNHFKYHLKSVCDALYTKHYLMGVKGTGNFRDDIYPEYKAQRKDKPHGNYFVQMVRDLAIEEEIAIPCHDRETDDYLRIWAEECDAIGAVYVVCTIDKDLDRIPKLHWNLKKNELTDVTKEYAMRFYYEQLLMGDPTDNIPGLPKVGPIRAKDLLAECETHADFQFMVVEAYKAYYAEEWRDYLLSNGKMIYIQKQLNDYFTLENWTYQDFKVIEKVPEIVPDKPSSIATLRIKPKVDTTLSDS